MIVADVPFSATVYAAMLSSTVPAGGSGSSSVIVRIAVLGLPSVAPTAPESVRLTVSSPSHVESSRIATVNVFDTASPSPKLIVPDVDV